MELEFLVWTRESVPPKSCYCFLDNSKSTVSLQFQKRQLVWTRKKQTTTTTRADFLGFVRKTNCGSSFLLLLFFVDFLQDCGWISVGLVTVFLVGGRSLVWREQQQQGICVVACCRRCCGSPRNTKHDAAVTSGTPFHESSTDRRRSDALLVGRRARHFC